MDKKKVFTKPTEKAKLFRLDKEVADKLEKLAKLNRRTEKATIEIIIEEAYKAQVEK